MVSLSAHYGQHDPSFCCIDGQLEESPFLSQSLYHFTLTVPLVTHVLSKCTSFLSFRLVNIMAVDSSYSTTCSPIFNFFVIASLGNCEQFFQSVPQYYQLYYI